MSYDQLVQGEMQPGVGSGAYLDHAGATPAPKSLLEAAFRDLLANQCDGNPHSHSAYEGRMDGARASVHAHFRASPDQYDVVFTSGATQALKLVGELFAFGPAGALLYPLNVHTSVLGIRAYAPQSFPFPSSTLYAVGALQELSVPHPPLDSNNLVVIPGECNFSGAKCDMAKVAKWIHGFPSPCYWLLDAAKLAATSPLDLFALPAAHQPHFVVASFYKMFGYPTGLGVLLIRREACSSVMLKRYYGGGTISAATADEQWVEHRPEFAARLEAGTPHYQGIAAVPLGFAILARLGGLAAIQRNVMALTLRLARALARMRHSCSGRRVCTVFGRHFLSANEYEGIEERELDDLAAYCARQGPVVTFTVFWADGSPVGHTDTCLLAAAENITLRGGCFCNPGGCQEWLSLSADDVRANLLLGRSCAGHDGQGDVVNGLQTGAVRASLGWCSCQADCDTLVDFLTRHFAGKRGPTLLSSTLSLFRAGEEELGTHSTTAVGGDKGSGLLVSELYVYPVKSCGAVRVSRWPLTTSGLFLDREWAIVDAGGRAMTQKLHPRLALLRPSFDLELGFMYLAAPEGDVRPPLVVDIGGDVAYRATLATGKVLGDKDLPGRKGCSERAGVGGESARGPSPRQGGALFEQVRVCGQMRLARQEASEAQAGEWLSAVLGSTCYLMRRKANDRLTCNLGDKGVDSTILDGGGSGGSFSNEAELLLVNEASMLFHQSQMMQRANAAKTHDQERETAMLPARTANFRPNVVVRGAGAHSEDTWRRLRISADGPLFDVTGPCQRCSVINVDGGTGVIDRRALEVLAGYRHRMGSGSIHFGMFLALDKSYKERVDRGQLVYISLCDSLHIIDER